MSIEDDIARMRAEVDQGKEGMRFGVSSATIWIAATQRRGTSERGSYTEKQSHLLDILRASPEPISCRKIMDVCRCLPRRWKGLTGAMITACLRGLEARGVVCSVAAAGAGHYRGRQVLVWFPATEEASTATSPEDAKRLREIQILIEDQERDETDAAHERGHWADKSIDAPLTADGFTILDTLGETDEALDELVEEYA